MKPDEVRELCKKIEEKLGGPVAAAEGAGIKYVTWWRWRTGKTIVGHRIETTLRLLWNQIK